MIELLSKFPIDWLNSGVFGICAVLLWMNYQDRKSMGRLLNQNATETRQVIRDNSNAMRQLGQMLHDRPCLQDNGRALSAGDLSTGPAGGFPAGQAGSQSQPAIRKPE